MKANAPLSLFCSVVGSFLITASSASALTYYWDGNDATTGFGTAGGTWADPTAGTLTSGWSTSNTGITTVDGISIATTTADSLNFGTDTTGNGLAAGTINITGTVNAGSITFGNKNGAVILSGGTINLAAAGTITVGVNTTINSVISGAGTSFTKTGNSVLTLNGLNTYTGATRIGNSTNGVLEVSIIANGGVASGIGASTSAASNLVLANDNFGALRYIGSTNASTDRDFTIANGAGAYSGSIESSGTGTLTFTSTNAVTYITANFARNFVLSGTNTGQNTLSAQLINNGSGALTFTKSGVGTWVLANEANSYTGKTSINGGILSVSKMADYGMDSSIGKGTAGTAIGFDTFGTSVGTLIYTGSGDDTDRLIQGTRDGIILNNGTGALNFTATGNLNVQTTQSIARGFTFGGTNGGTISGGFQNNTGSNPALSIIKIGSGTWILAGSNTYTGNTDVNAGTLRLQSGATSITQTLGTLRNQSADGTLNSNKSGTGNITTTFSSYTRAAGATGNIVSTGGTNGTDNSVNITGAAGFINAGLYFGGSDFAARNGLDGYVRALAYGSDASTAAIDTVTASNHVKLTTTSYSGAGVTLLSLNLAGGGINWTNTSGNLSTPGILKSGGGSQSTISGGNVTTASNAELVIRTDTSSDLLAITANLTQGSGALTKSGAGTLTLSGTNTYTGQTHVNAGTLSISSNVNLGAQTTGATLNLKGGTLQATGTFGLYNGTAGTNNRAVTLLDQSSIEVTGSNTLTIAGVMSNNASAGVTTPGFSKTGTGTLLLSGTNTYTGTTTVSAGKLVVNGSIATSSLTTVQSGATIGGSGTIGALTISSGGFINPGNSPGILTVSGNYTQDGQLNFEAEGLTAGNGAGNYDQIVVNGTVTLGSGSTFNISSIAGFTPVNGSLLFILLNDGTDAISGTFSGLAQEASVGTYLGYDWKISYVADSAGTTFTGGNDIALQANVIPEPKAALLGALGALLLLRRRR